MKSSEISVVVHGIVENSTKALLASIRKYLPHSEVIISTWETSNYHYLDCDKLVINKDLPAFVFDYNLNKLNNINRIIVSTKAGLKKASRKYTLHLRSDMLMVNDNILKFCDNFKRNKKYSLFKNRIFAYEMFSLQFEEKFQKKYYSIFHISDWCHFGLTEDIRELFNIKPVREPDFSLFFKDKSINGQDIFPERLWKMSPEQYISSENCKKIIPSLKVEHRLDWREEVLSVSDAFIVNNYIVKSIKDWGIVITKDLYKNKNILSSSVTKKGAWLGENWYLSYKKYCDTNYRLPLKYQWMEKLKVCRDMEHLYKHYNNFVNPIKVVWWKFRKFSKWFVEPLSMLYYAVKICFKVLTRFHRLFKN